VAADPASVALLLAEPASERDPDSGISVTPPRRTGVGFTAVLHLVDALGRTIAGEVTATPASDAGCELRLVLSAPDSAAARGLERSATGFLAELAARARSRSRAA
jgi:hypothetical protein